MFAEKPPTLEEAATRMYEAGAALRLAADQLEGVATSVNHEPPPREVLTMLHARARAASAVLWGIKNWHTTYDGPMKEAYLRARDFHAYANAALLLEAAIVGAIHNPMHPTTTYGGTVAGAVYEFARFHLAEFMIECGEKWTEEEPIPA